MRVWRALSLLWVVPTLAAGWLCARSFRSMDEWSEVDGDNVLRAVVSYRGAIHFVRAENNSTRRPWAWDRYDTPPAATWNDLYPAGDVEWRKFGFAKVTSSPPAAPAFTPMVPRNAAPARPRQLAPWLFTRPYRAYAIPYWAPLALTTPPALLAVARLLRRFVRGRRGLCAGCGYDLRATAERCPECGEPVPRRLRRADAAGGGGAGGAS